MQLEKANDSVSIANLRAAYAEASTAYLTEQGDTVNQVTYNSDKTVTVAGIQFKGTKDGWSGLATDLPFEADTGKTYLSDTAKEGGTKGIATAKFDFSTGKCVLKELTVTSSSTEE